MVEKTTAKKFTNILEETFKPVWDGAEWEIGPGETVMVEAGIADTFASKLLQIVANEKYDGIMPPEKGAKLLGEMFGDKIEEKEDVKFQDEVKEAKKEEEDAAAEAVIEATKKDLKNSAKAKSNTKGKDAKEAKTTVAAAKKAKAEAAKAEKEAKAKLKGEEVKDEVFEDAK